MELVATDSGGNLRVPQTCDEDDTFSGDDQAAPVEFSRHDVRCGGGRVHSPEISATKYSSAVQCAAWHLRNFAAASIGVHRRQT